MNSFFMNGLVWGWMATLVLGTQSLPSQSPWTEVFKFRSPGSLSMGSIFVGNSSVATQFALSYPETRIPTGVCDPDDGYCVSLYSYKPEDSPWFHANDSAPTYNGTSNITGEYCMDQVTLIMDNKTELALNYSFVQTHVEGGAMLGMVGFGFANQEYTNQGKDGYIYDNFMETLKKSPLRALFTGYTSSFEDEESTLLFGAIDSAKYDHDIGFRTYDIYNPLSYGKEGPPADWGIVMDEFTIYDDSSDEVILEVDTSNYTTIVDVLSYQTYLAPALYQQFIEHFNFTQDEYGYGYYVTADDVKGIYVNLAFGDLEYKSSLWNNTIKNPHEETDLNLVAIVPNNADYNVIGTHSLKNDGYVVYDYENRTVSLGKLKKSDGEVDLNEDIVTISNTLPDSKKVTDVPKETRSASESETGSMETDSSETEEPSDSSETSEPSDSSETSTSSGFGTKTTTKWSFLTFVLFYLM